MKVERDDEKHRERLELEKAVKEKTAREARIFRTLLAAGEKDDLFTGFNGDEKEWLKEIEKTPNDWVWVRAKYGIIGCPFPGGKEYSFPPKAKFPLYREYQDYVHESMKGEVREI